jgi:hypothetical protein
VRDVNDQVVQQGDKLELLIPPDPRVIGTALSYRLALLWTGDIATTPAGVGRELIPQLAEYATLFSTNRVREKRLLLDAGDRLWTRITELCAHPSLRLQAAPASRDDGFIVPTRGARLLASVGDMLDFLSGTRRSLLEWRAMFRTALERQVTRATSRGPLRARPLRAREMPS